MPERYAAPIASDHSWTGHRSAYLPPVGTLRFPKTFAAAEFCFAVIALTMFMGGLVNLLIRGGDAAAVSLPDEAWTDDKRELVRALFFPIYGISWLLLITWWRRLYTAIANNLFLVMFILMTSLSTFWSIDPDTTARRSAALLSATAFAAYFGIRYNTREMLRLLAISCAGIVILSYVFALLLPSLGKSAELDFAWRGVTPHKNVLGRAMLISVLAFVISQPASRRMAQLRWLGIVAATALTWLSKSMGSVIVLAAVAPVMLAIRSLQLGAKKRLAYFFVILTVSYFVLAVSFIDLDMILDFMDKDPTMTGRTALWPLVLHAIEDRPWLGYGYSVFWDAAVLGPQIGIWELMEWTAPNAHNNFLDVCLSVGLPGLTFLILSILVSFRNAIIAFRHGRRLEAEWGFLYLFLLISANLTESLFSEPNSIWWVLYVVTTIQLRFTVLDIRQKTERRRRDLPLYAAAREP
jgi:O-antigen ligase